MIMDVVELHNRELLLSCSDDPFFSSGSELSSPIGSSSTQSSELEGDDYIGELTRQMAQYMLQDEDNKHEKTWGLPDSSESNTSTSIQVSRRSPNVFQSKQALIDDQIRAIQSRLKQEQAMKEAEQKPRIKHNNSLYNPQQQLRQSNQQAGSNMRAVFLNSPGSRNVSSGTGVFLPRGTGTPCQSRKTQGCATVLIPARVVQALKLHFEKTGVPPRFNNVSPLQHDASASGGKSTMYSQQKSQSRTVPPAINHQEMDLPQEWTY